MMPVIRPWTRLARAAVPAVLMGAAIAAPALRAEPGATPRNARAATADVLAGAAASPSAMLDGAASGDEAVACVRMRRKLWVEGEGWIIRRVSICR